jgi:hypothetical protein
MWYGRGIVRLTGYQDMGCRLPNFASNIYFLAIRRGKSLKDWPRYYGQAAESESERRALFMHD